MATGKGAHWAPGTGISNKLSGGMERTEHAAIMEHWSERCAHGAPGTHTLGKEFDTKPKEDKAN